MRTPPHLPVYQVDYFCKMLSRLLSLHNTSSLRYCYHAGALRFSSAAASPSTAGAASTASTSGAADLREVPELAARRISKMFYSPDVRLSRRQQTVFSRLEDMPRVAPAPDHGFLYGLTAAEVSSASESVRRALSTRTGSQADMRRFRAADVITRFGASPRDSGSSRVQGACASRGRTLPTRPPGEVFSFTTAPPPIPNPVFSLQSLN